MPMDFSNFKCNLFAKTPVDSATTVDTASERKPFISDETKQKMKNLFSFKKDALETSVSTTEAPTAEPKKSFKDRVTSFLSSKKETDATDSSAVVSTTPAETKPSYLEKAKALALRTFTSTPDTPEEKAAKATIKAEAAEQRKHTTFCENENKSLKNDLNNALTNVKQAHSRVIAFTEATAPLMSSIINTALNNYDTNAHKINGKEVATTEQRLESTKARLTQLQKWNNGNLDISFNEITTILRSTEPYKGLTKTEKEAVKKDITNLLKCNINTCIKEIEIEVKTFENNKASKDKTAQITAAIAATKKAEEALQAYNDALTNGVEALTQKVEDGSLTKDMLEYSSKTLANVHGKDVNAVKQALLEGIAPSIQAILSDKVLKVASDNFDAAGNDIINKLDIYRDKKATYDKTAANTKSLTYVEDLGLDNTSQSEALAVYTESVAEFKLLTGVKGGLNFTPGDPHAVKAAITTATKAANQKKKDEHNLVRENLIKNANLNTYQIFDEAIANFEASKDIKVKPRTFIDMFNAFRGVTEEAADECPETFAEASWTFSGKLRDAAVYLGAIKE